MRRCLLRVVAALILAGTAWSGPAAEPVTVGIVKTSASGHVFIALERGYFADEGLEVSLIPFEAAQPVAIAVVTGNLDIGVSALTAALYSLGGQGALRLVAGQSRDLPTYQNICYVASDRAFAAGLRAPKDIAGHSVALTQIGAPSHYALGMLAEKYHFDLKSLRLLPLQSFPNIASALAGRQADVGMLAATPCLAAVNGSDLKLIGWVGDETPWQIGGVFVATATADERGALVRRFLRAYVRGARDYYAAFSAPDGRRADGRTASDTRAIIAKYTGQPPDALRDGIGYVDPEARLDLKDILRQIAWYKAQHMLKLEGDGADIIDRRYAKLLP
jgi:NitT/TauT family transport system substrate-binding protein